MRPTTVSRNRGIGKGAGHLLRNAERPYSGLDFRVQKTLRRRSLNQSHIQYNIRDKYKRWVN